MDKAELMVLTEYLRTGLGHLEAQGVDLGDNRKQIEELSDKSLSVVLVLSLTLAYNMTNQYMLTSIQGILNDLLLAGHSKH